MANNNIYIVHPSTGTKVHIGKFYPGTGWYVLDPQSLGEELNKAFHKVDFGEMPYEDAQKNKICSSGGMLGHCDWKILYEITSDGKNEIDQ